MTEISRNPKSTARERFDLVVIGGGIYGVCMLLEASRRGWKSLLIERDDFGGKTSWNSLRIIHGGLRYLQNMDLPRFRRSVQEQAWWLTHFPDLVTPLPCMMPLYNQGLRRVGVLRLALRLNDCLAKRIRHGTRASKVLAASTVVNVAQTLSRFPGVRQDGLRGAATWYDARIDAPQRLLIELLRWSVAAGGEALNYMECVGFEQKAGRATAVKARCGVSKDELVFKTNYVVNCTGPWLGHIAGLATADTVRPTSAEHAIAFNLVLNRTPPCDWAVAVSPRQKNSHTFFVVPHREKTLAGTKHLRPQSADRPSKRQVSTMLEDLNMAIPDWNLTLNDVDQVLAGRLPPESEGSHVPAKSPTITHHDGRSVGVRNMTSVKGSKYTTARLVACTALRQIAEHASSDFTTIQLLNGHP